jgi:hypothetical protein
MKLPLRNLIVTIVVLQAIMTLITLYMAWRVKEIYDAIPGEPGNGKSSTSTEGGSLRAVARAG